MEFIDGNDAVREFDSNNVFDYHGVSLVSLPVTEKANAIRVYEPAYGIDVFGNDMPGSAQSSLLDAMAKGKESCQYEGNYLGEVAFNIIANDRQVKNPEYNKPFQEKIESMRKNVLAKIRKGVAITVAFAAVACFSPKLSAESSLTVKTVGMAQYDNPVVYYAENKASDVVTLEDFSHMLNEDAKSAIRQAYPKMKESDKKYKGLLESTIKTFCDSSSGYLEKKFGSSRISVDDNNCDYAAFFFSDSGVLLSAEAVEYRAKVNRGTVSPDLELSSGTAVKASLDTGRGR